MREEDVCLELLLGWLAAQHGRRFTLDQSEYVEPAGLSAVVSDAVPAGRQGSFRLALEVRPLLGPSENPAWLAYRDQLRTDIAMDLQGAFALWLPAGADLPSGARERIEFVQHVRKTALALAPGDRAYVPLPISLYLKKLSGDGNLMSVVGGLNAYWARFTDRIRGTYDLDASQLHRLPESEEHLEALLDLICRRTQSIETAGQWVEIETVDAWTVQRLAGDHGVVIVGLPPDEIGDMGLAVRRNFRRLLAEAAPRLAERQADLRALVALGHYGRMDQEGATTAMRGYDPALYSNLDFVCLAADGLLKPLIQAPARVLPWASR